jgi:hypothetical protein
LLSFHCWSGCHYTTGRRNSYDFNQTLKTNRVAAVDCIPTQRKVDKHHRELLFFPPPPKKNTEKQAGLQD